MLPHGRRLSQLAVLLLPVCLLLVGSPMAKAGEAGPDAKTWANLIDGQEMVVIPAGEATIGADDGEANERPSAKVYVPAFAIGRTEVTVGQFRRFLRESGYAPQGPWDAAPQADDCPVAGVTWADARAYCDWALLRLPTEAEWERAARGPGSLKWPWGDGWVAGRCNIAGDADGHAQAAPVGRFADGASPFGCLDMAGNVWEFTASLFRPCPYDSFDGRESYAQVGAHVVRGGGWTDDAGRARTTCRFEGSADGHGANMGFRCARTLPITVSLQAADTEVRTALADLFKPTPYRHTVDDSVGGHVSFSAKDSPFEQALNGLLAAASLSYRLENGNYRISGPRARANDADTDYRAMATQAVAGLLKHFWVGDAATGRVLHTYGGRGDPQPPNRRGILWERATFVALLENVYQVTRDPRLRRRVAAEWAHLKDQFLPRELQSCGDGSQNPCHDDAGWTALMYLRIYRMTRDPDALAHARALVTNAYDRWTDTEFGGGLWYRDPRDGRTSYQSALILAGIWIYELTKERSFLDRAVALTEWGEKRLLRPDGLYWWWYARGGPERYPEPRGEGVSDVFLGGNMGMAVVHARLLRVTGAAVHKERALRTADAIVAGETDGKGGLLNDRDAWANGYFMGEWAREVTALPGARGEYAEAIRRTARGIWEHARTPEGLLSACWSGHPEGQGCPWSAEGVAIRSSKSYPEQIMTSASSANVIVAAAALPGG